MSNQPSAAARRNKLNKVLSYLIFFVFMFVMPLAMADGSGGDSGEAQTKMCTVMNNIHGILKVASVLIVTIAIIFAGYQIAFAHKRISEVAPILIGGLLIGAAGSIAMMIIGSSEGFQKDCTSTSSGKTAVVLVVDTLRNA